MNNIDWDHLQELHDEQLLGCPWLDEESSWYDKQREKEEYQADMGEE